MSSIFSPISGSGLLWFRKMQCLRQFLLGKDSLRDVDAGLPELVGKEGDLRHIEMEFFHAVYLGEHLPGRALQGDLPLIHDEDLIRVDGLLHVVGDEDDGDVLYLIQSPCCPDDLVPSRGIEHGGGLIHDDALGVHGDDAGDGDALLLPAGETVRGLLSKLPHEPALLLRFPHR